MESIDDSRPLEYDFFLVHAGTAMTQAEELHDAMDRVEGARVFLDKASITPGTAWPTKIGDALKASRIAVVLITPGLAKAYYVPEEIHRAIADMRASGRPLVLPVYLGGTSPESDAPYGLSGIQSITWPVGQPLGELAERLLDEWRNLPDPTPVLPPPSPEARPYELVVDPHGSGPNVYPTVRRALAKAVSGTKIRIRPGLYDETLTITQPVELLGDGPADKIILHSFNATTITLATTHARVAGLTVRQQGGTFPYQAIDISSGAPVIEGCFLVGGTKSAVRARGTSMPMVMRNIILGTSGVGIEIGDFASPIVAGNVVLEQADTGIWVGGRAHPILEDNAISRCANQAVLVGGEARVCVRTNRIKECGNGVVVSDSAYATLVSNTISSCRQSAVVVRDSSDGSIVGNTLTESGSAQVLVQTVGSPSFERNTIEHGRADGVVVFGPSGPEPITFACNRITDNQWSGAFIQNSARVKFRQNLVELNRDNGVTIHTEAGGSYDSNLIRRNGQNGLSLEGAATCDITLNRVHDNDWAGLYISASAPRCDRNLVHDNPWGAVTLANGSRAYLKENDLQAGANAAVLVRNADGAALTLNHIHNSDVGIDVRSGDVRIKNNRIDANKLGVRVAVSATIGLEQNSLAGNVTAFDATLQASQLAEGNSVSADLDEERHLRRTPLFVARLDKDEPCDWGAPAEPIPSEPLTPPVLRAV